MIEFEIIEIADHCPDCGKGCEAWLSFGMPCFMLPCGEVCSCVREALLMTERNNDPTCEYCGLTDDPLDDESIIVHNYDGDRGWFHPSCFDEMSKAESCADILP